MKIALVGCSDPRPENSRPECEKLAEILKPEGIDTWICGSIFGPASAEEKKKDLLSCFDDPEIRYIFDVSGGDLANGVLAKLAAPDWEKIRSSQAVMCGFSDLTVLLNAITAETGKETINYQIRNMLRTGGEEQRSYLLEHVLAGELPPVDLDCRFLRGHSMEGRVLGGNIRCLLKLAGTPYWPDMTGAILLLEAFSGGVNQLTTYLNQLKLMGVFEQIGGILLGTFTQMEEKGWKMDAPELVLSMVPDLPVAQTRRIGHGADAAAIVIGRKYTF